MNKAGCHILKSKTQNWEVLMLALEASGGGFPEISDAQTVVREVLNHSIVTSPISLLGPFLCQGFLVNTEKVERRVCSEPVLLHFCLDLYMNFGPL